MTDTNTTRTARISTLRTALAPMEAKVRELETKLANAKGNARGGISNALKKAKAGVQTLQAELITLVQAEQEAAKQDEPRVTHVRAASTTRDGHSAAKKAWETRRRLAAEKAAQPVAA